MISESLLQRDRLGRFARGHTPWNKGAYSILPDLAPSEDIAYILGVVYGDGYTTYHRGAWQTGLHTASKDFAESFRKALAKIGLHPSRVTEQIELTRVHRKRSTLYRTLCYSNRFAEFINSLSFYQLRLLLNDANLKWAFLRGFFESEGYMRVRERNRTQISFFNTNTELIHFVAELLTYLGFESSLRLNRTPSANWKPCYALNLKGNLNKKREFLFKLNPAIKGVDIPAGRRDNMSNGGPKNGRGGGKGMPGGGGGSKNTCGCGKGGPGGGQGGGRGGGTGRK